MEGLSYWHNFIEQNFQYIAKLPAALLTLGVAYILIRLVRRVILTATSVARVDKSVQSMVLSVVSFAGWIFGLAAALSVMELHQLSLALGGSIALIAMAMATGLNSVTQDLMAGMFLIGDEEFTVGKRVKAGGVEGNIVGVSIRKTRIQDDSGQVHTIPNRNVDGAIYIIMDDKADTEEKAG